MFRTGLVPCLELLNRKRSRSSSNQGEGEHLPSSSSCDNTSHGQNTPWAQLTGISTSNISAWNLQIVDNICEAKTWLEVLSINEIQTHQTEKKQQPIRAGCLYLLNKWLNCIHPRERWELTPDRQKASNVLPSGKMVREAKEKLLPTLPSVSPLRDFSHLPEFQSLWKLNKPPQLHCSSFLAINTKELSQP